MGATRADTTTVTATTATTASGSTRAAGSSASTRAAGSSASTRAAGSAGAAATLDLLDRARHSLLEACQSQQVTRRYDQAQLGALRAAAAVVATRTTSSHPSTGQSGPRSLWELLPTVAPELSEWAGFFEVVGARRHHGHSAREADDLLRQSELFLDLVCRTLGLPVAVSPHDHLLVPTALTHQAHPHTAASNATASNATASNTTASNTTASNTTASNTTARAAP